MSIIIFEQFFAFITQYGNTKGHNICPDKSQHDNCGFKPGFIVLVQKHLHSLNETGVHHLCVVHKPTRGGWMWPRDQLRVNICMQGIGYKVSQLCFPSKKKKKLPQTRADLCMCCLHGTITATAHKRVNKCQVIRMSSCGEGWSVTEAQMGKPTTDVTTGSVRKLRGIHTQGLNFSCHTGWGKFEFVEERCYWVNHQQPTHILLQICCNLMCKCIKNKWRSCKGTNEVESA